MLRTLFLGFKRIKYTNSISFCTSNNEILDNYGFNRMSSSFRPEHLNVIRDQIDNKEYITHREWLDIKETLKTIRGIYDSNVDSIILQYLINSDRLQQAKDYVKQLKDNKIPFNVAVIGNLMKIYHMSDCSSITQEDKQDILYYYDILLKKYKVLDYKTNTQFGCAILLTDRWRESLNILEEIKKTSKPPRLLYGKIIEAAFHYGDSELGWKYFEEMCTENILPNTDSYLSWLNYSLSLHKDNKDGLLECLEKMLNFCSANDLHMPQQAVVQYMNAFNKILNWNSDIVSVDNRGVCKKCKTQFQTADVTSEEFQLLKSQFYDKVLIGKNVFSKSTPEERQNFLTFLNSTAPYDVVLDGLNLLYSAPNMKKTEILISVVKYFVEKDKKVLVLGRKHLQSSLKKSQLTYILTNGRMFLTDDLSYDDVFLLYATLYSENTQFVSRDLMRGHKFLLEDAKLQDIFKKWQMKNQLILKYVDRNGRVFLNQPNKYLGSAQKHIGWHVPFSLEDFAMLPDSYEFSKNWVCLQPPKKRMSVKL